MLPAFANRTPTVDYTESERRFLITYLGKAIIELFEIVDIHNDFVGMVWLYSETRLGLAKLLPTKGAETTSAECQSYRPRKTSSSRHSF
jgi:hypothetical protein